jgi:quinol monooxygenase YgiN
MIILAVTAVVKPEQREEALRAALAMGTATRAEPGCVAYRFYADLEDPNRFFLFEEWENEEALARHGETEHMRVFRERLPVVLAAPLVVKRYDATAR